MTDDPVCTTSGRSEPARFNGGASTGSLAVGRKLQPKRFVRQQVCAAVFSTKHSPVQRPEKSEAADSGRCVVERGPK